MRVELVGFADTATFLRVCSWGLGHRVARGGDGAGQDGPVGGGALDHPQDVSVGVGAAGHPGDGSVDAGTGRWEILGTDQLAGRGGQHGVDVVTGVGINPDDKWVGMRDDRNGGHGTFPK